MAFTSIIQRVQVLLNKISCDLCDTQSGDYWKCSQCDQVLCNQCKAIHLRSRVSHDHSLQPLSKMADSPKMGLPNFHLIENNSLCEKHHSETIQMFCKDCKQLVCIDCVVQQHQGHKFAKTGTVVMEMKQELLLQASNSKKKVVELENSIQSLDLQRNIYSRGIEDLIKQRQIHADRLKSEIDTVTNDLIALLRKREKRDLQKMNKNRLNLISSKETLQDFVNTDKNFLQNADDVFSIRVAMEMKKVLDIPESSLSANLLRPPQIRANLDEERCLKDAVGYIDDNLEYGDDTARNILSEAAENQEAITFSILDSMRTNLEIMSKFKPEITASRIYPISATRAWIGNYCTDLMLVTIEGTVEKRIKTEFDVYDFASNNCEELFITQYNGCTVQKLKEDGKCILVCDTSPLKTRGISINKENNILVVLTDDTGKGEKLIKLNTNGQIIQTIMINNSPLISRPSLVMESVKTDICVIDSRKAIVVTDCNGTVKFEHKGLPGMDGFAPRGIACDGFGNILVSDSISLAVYLLNTEGKFLKCIITKDDGLKAPHKISLDNSGQLWIADWNQIKVIRYS